MTLLTTTGGRPLGFGAAAILLTIALVGAISAGVLGTVGPYLVGVSVLVAALFALGRR